MHNRLIGAALSTTLAFFLGACGNTEQVGKQPVKTEQSYTLKLAETWGPGYPIFGDSTKSLAQMVDKMSAGRLKITIDSSNKHKAPFGIFDMVKAGQYDMGHSASYYWKGKDPNTLVRAGGHKPSVGTKRNCLDVRKMALSLLLQGFRYVRQCDFVLVGLVLCKGLIQTFGCRRALLC